MLTDTTRSPYAKVHALDGMKVKWTGGLWKERFDTCANSTVPQLKHMFDSKDISHVVENFKICAEMCIRDSNYPFALRIPYPQP